LPNQDEDPKKEFSRCQLNTVAAVARLPYIFIAKEQGLPVVKGFQ
jgi:hypothetical protein